MVCRKHENCQLFKSRALFNLSPKYFQISTIWCKICAKIRGTYGNDLELQMSTHVANATSPGQGGGWGWLDIEWRGLGGQRGVWYTWLIFHNYGYLLTCNLALGDTHLLTHLETGISSTQTGNPPNVESILNNLHFPSHVKVSESLFLLGSSTKKMYKDILFNLPPRFLGTITST